MKRLGSSDSLGALMSVCPPTDQEHSPRNNHMYSREFQSMLDGLEEEGCVEESSHALGEKKRRLSIDQVKALEKNFEVENKLEPERKVKLAQELGLQPRQVAVWFQNRRARWKTKQLERDYGVLKAKYDALKINYDALKHDNQALLKEIQELKSKLNEENAESNLSVKEEVNMPNDSDTNPVDDDESKPTLVTSETKELSFNGSVDGGGGGVCKVSIFADVTKDGSSDSDSSAILNEENSSSPHAAISSSATGQTHLATSSQQQSSSFMSCFQFQKVYQPLPQYVKMEEHNFFSGDEACNFFSDEQPPTLPWYCSDQWS